MGGGGESKHETALSGSRQRVIFQFGLGGKGGQSGLEAPCPAGSRGDFGFWDPSPALSLGRRNFGEARCFSVEHTPTCPQPPVLL